MLILRNKLPNIINNNEWYYPELLFLKTNNNFLVISNLNIKAVIFNKNKIIENKNIKILIKNVENKEKEWFIDYKYINYKFNINVNKDFKNIYLKFETYKDSLIVGPFNISFNISKRNDFNDTIINNYKIYCINNKNIIIKELFEHFFYGKIWESSFILLDYFKDIIGSDYFINKKIIDISGGTGFLGICLGILLKNLNTEITITEHPDRFYFLKQNYILNKEYIKDNVKIKDLVWGKYKKNIYKNKYDIIISADLIYDYRYYNDLLFTFKTLYRKKSLIYIAFKERNPKDEKLFIQMLKKEFIFTEIRFKKNNINDIYIYKIYGKKLE